MFIVGILTIISQGPFVSKRDYIYTQLSEKRKTII